MKKPEMFFKTLRYICLIGVIAFGLMTIVCTGGGGGENDGSNSAPASITWENTFGGTDNDYGGDAQQISDGGYILFGSWNGGGGGGGDCSGTDGFVCSGDFYLIRTDENGNSNWEKTFGGTDCEIAGLAHETSDGGYILCGSTKSYGAGQSDVYLLKTD